MYTIVGPLLSEKEVAFAWPSQDPEDEKGLPTGAGPARRAGHAPDGEHAYLRRPRGKSRLSLKEVPEGALSLANCVVFYAFLVNARE